MPVTGYFVGTVHGIPENKVSKAGKPFTSFVVAQKGKYDTYLRCALMGDGHPQFYEGDIVSVSGDLTADGYVSKKTGQPVGSLKMFVRNIEKMQVKPIEKAAFEEARNKVAQAASSADGGNDIEPPF